MMRCQAVVDLCRHSQILQRVGGGGSTDSCLTVCSRPVCSRVTRAHGHQQRPTASHSLYRMISASRILRRSHPLPATLLSRSDTPKSSPPAISDSRRDPGLPPPHPHSHSQYRRTASPVKTHHALTVNGSTASAAPTLPSPSNVVSRFSLVWARQRLVLTAALISLVIAIPLLHLLLTSPYITSAFCSSTFLASSSLHIPLAPSLLSPTSTSDSSSPYQPSLFALPSPSSYIFLTSHVDPSTSLHTQFQQFLYAPYLALTLNLSYAYNPLSKAQGEWGRWLGLGWGEKAEDGLLGEWGRVRVFQYEASEDGRGLQGMEGKEAVQDWIVDRQRKVDDINSRLLDYSRNKHKLGNMEPPRIDEPKGSHIDGPDTTAINPTSPINTASVLRLSRLPLPSLQLACHAPLHLSLRQKYCAARVREPVPVDLFGEDRARGRMIVAVHFRCGDECYHPTRAVPLSTTLNTLTRIRALVTQHSLPPPAFHVFTSPPNNDTAESFFHPLTTAFPTARLHLSVHSHLLLHHLVTSDVLVTAQCAVERPQLGGRTACTPAVWCWYPHRRCTTVVARWPAIENATASLMMTASYACGGGAHSSRAPGEGSTRCSTAMHSSRLCHSTQPLSLARTVKWVGRSDFLSMLP